MKPIHRDRLFVFGLIFSVLSGLLLLMVGVIKAARAVIESNQFRTAVDVIGVTYQSFASILANFGFIDWLVIAFFGGIALILTAYADSIKE